MHRDVALSVSGEAASPNTLALGRLHQLLRALMNVPHRVKALYAIPAAIYMINNNLYYWILQHLDATTLQVGVMHALYSTSSARSLFVCCGGLPCRCAFISTRL